MSYGCRFYNEHGTHPLKGKDKYELDDDDVVYFCFPTLGVAVPLRPGDFLLSMLLYHIVYRLDAGKLTKYLA